MAKAGQEWPADPAPADNASKPRARKRRRTAGGAGDDCWTCQRRSVTCDRKRPYCSQCLEIGRECSGYKTTLSWGVGVASRGKLRGLSCPVANKNVDGSDIVPAVKAKDGVDRPAATATHIKLEQIPEASAVPAPSIGDSISEPTAPQIKSEPPAAPIEYTATLAPGESSARRHAPLDYSMDLAMGQSRPRHGSAGMVDALHPMEPIPEYAVYSPTQHRHSVPTGISTHNRLPPILTYLPMEGHLTQRMSSGAVFADGTSTPSDPGAFDPYNSALPGVDDALITSAASYQQLWSPDPAPYTTLRDEDEGNADGQWAIADVRFASPFYHLSPRIQSLMEHYDRNVCTYLVAFDGVENPYRKHILQLAINNEGLQNAIAALSANNLRMRRKEPRPMGYVNELPDDGTLTLSANEALAEESCYKQMAIDELNTRLMDRSAAQDDAVLATLLILCLYHVCDSGFSKFKTQLAGVQKLLAFRSSQTHSDFTRWVQMFFAWFDAMTSTVNDREMEIRGDSGAMLDLSTGLGAMEQFSGCDGRLFKLIARLGRLNLLAQGRHVKSAAGGQTALEETPTAGFGLRNVKRKRKVSSGGIRSLSAFDYRNIDGNGWGTPIISSDEESENSSDDAAFQSDGRDAFWAEWREMKTRLQSFEMEPQNISSATSPNVPDTNPVKLELDQRDIVHINESFRFSALLYIERLAHPHRSSAHPFFQDIVARALVHFHALAPDSCVNKFLLWPLFIIGTECVDHEQRAFIRRRCIDVQIESGFYNNISTLDVLERAWAEAGTGAHVTDAEERRARRRDSRPLLPGRYAQAFRWRKAMDRADGEYLVI